MVTETTIQMTLLRPKKFQPLKLGMTVMFVAYFVLMAKIKANVYNDFLQLPQEKQVLSYTADELEDAKLYNITLPPIQNTKEEVLARWDDGNEVYQGSKLLLLVPVTLLLCYVLFNHWSMSFRAWASFRPTDKVEHAHFAKLDVVHKTGLVHEAHKVYLCKVYHYYYQGKYYQQIEFENEKYNIVAGNDQRYRLEQHYQKIGTALPTTDVEHGLSSQEHYENVNKYGENRIILKYPVYIKILLDEILSPYFAF